MNSLVRDTNQASSIICRGAKSLGLPRWAKDKLESAHSYLYAAMMADFVVMAESQIICDGVQMDSGEVKTGRQFLIDDVIGKILLKISHEHHGEADSFTSGIRQRMNTILDADAIPDPAHQSAEVIKAEKEDGNA